MLLLLYRLLFGSVTLRVTAEHPEKLLNLCAAKGIGIWRVTRKGEQIYFKIGVSSFRKLRFYKRGIPCRIHIMKKTGFPFFAARNRHRYGMVLGVVLFFAVLQLLSGFVWNICVTGNDAVSAKRIVEALGQIGIREGTPIAKIDPEEKRNELLLKESGLSWASINIEGSKLTVNVVETKQNEQKEEAPSNIKAGQAGVIRRLEVIRGATVVSPGDPVEKGQLLVSGVLEYEDQSSNLVRALGAVYAEVEQTITVRQPLCVTEQLRTGQTETRRVLTLFGLRLPLFLGRISEPYESEIRGHSVSDGGAYLPIRLDERRFYMTKTTTYQISEQVAKERARKKLEQLLKEELAGGELLARKETYQLEKEELVLSCRIICIKDIGIEEKIQLDTRN